MHNIGPSPWTTSITCWGSLFHCSALGIPPCSWWHQFSRISFILSSWKVQFSCVKPSTDITTASPNQDLTQRISFLHRHSMKTQQSALLFVKNMERIVNTSNFSFIGISSSTCKGELLQWRVTIQLYQLLLEMMLHPKELFQLNVMGKLLLYFMFLLLVALLLPWHYSCGNKSL